MTDNETLSREQREKLCFEEDCKEHEDGDTRCPIPLYKEDLQKALQGRDSASAGIGNAEPKTATGAVVRSDE